MEDIRKGSRVKMKSGHKSSNLLDWEVGIVEKISLDEDEVLINTSTSKGEHRFWEYIDYLTIYE